MQVRGKQVQGAPSWVTVVLVGLAGMWACPENQVLLPTKSILQSPNRVCLAGQAGCMRPMQQAVCPQQVGVRKAVLGCKCRQGAMSIHPQGGQEGRVMNRKVSAAVVPRVHQNVEERPEAHCIPRAHPRTKEVVYIPGARR